MICAACAFWALWASPINPEAWQWYHKNIGGGELPIVDTWWQTETGGAMISPMPYATKLKPGSAAKPLPALTPRSWELPDATARTPRKAAKPGIW